MNRYGQDWDKRRIKTWMWQETCSPGEKEESDLHQCLSGDQEDDWWDEAEKGQGWTGGGWIDPSIFWGWRIIANFVADPLFFPEQGICIKIWQEPGVCDQALIFCSSCHIVVQKISIKKSLILTFCHKLLIINKRWMHHNSHRSAFAILNYSCNFIFGIIGHTCLEWGFVPSQTPFVMTILLALNVQNFPWLSLFFPVFP